MTEVAISLLLVALAVALSLGYGFRLEAELMLATIRAIVQLTVIASLIHLVLSYLSDGRPYFCSSC